MFSEPAGRILNCAKYGQYFTVPVSLLMPVCLEVFHGYYSHASARPLSRAFFCPCHGRAAPSSLKLLMV